MLLHDADTSQLLYTLCQKRVQLAVPTGCDCALVPSTDSWGQTHFPLGFRALPPPGPSPRCRAATWLFIAWKGCQAPWRQGTASGDGNNTSALCGLPGSQSCLFSRGLKAAVCPRALRCRRGPARAAQDTAQSQAAVRILTRRHSLVTTWAGDGRSVFPG